MIGIKIAGTMALLSGTGASIMAVIEPRDLDGLGPTALLAVITLASLGLVVFMIRSVLGPVKDLTVKIEKLCIRMETRKCLFSDDEIKRRDEEIELELEMKARNRRDQ